jgi:hypothetical protein
MEDMKMLHGIEELTYDGNGYVFWKGQKVEHYDHPTDESMKGEALKLARRCRLLEKRGQEVNSLTAVWQWDESGKGDKWEIAFHNCKASEKAKNAAKRIVNCYGINGLRDAAYIANLIDDEYAKEL